MTHEITLRIRITSERIAAALLLSLLMGLPRVCSTADYQDISTLTTYYPQPAATFGDPGGGNPAIIVTGTAAIGRDYGTVTFGGTNTGATRVFMGGEWNGDPNILRLNGGIRVDGCLWLKNVNNPRVLGASYSPVYPPGSSIDTRWRCRWN